MAYGAAPESAFERVPAGTGGCSDSVVGSVSVMTIFARSFTPAG
jgi:hypothetical protein